MIVKVKICKKKIYPRHTYIIITVRRFLSVLYIQRVGHIRDQAVRLAVGGPRQTGKDRSVHHTPAQLLAVPHVRPRVHASPGLLHLQRVAKTVGPVPGTSRTRLQAHAQPCRLRYANVCVFIKILSIIIVAAEARDLVTTYTDK